MVLTYLKYFCPAFLPERTHLVLCIIYHHFLLLEVLKIDSVTIVIVLAVMDLEITPMVVIQLSSKCEYLNVRAWWRPIVESFVFKLH